MFTNLEYRELKEKDGGKEKVGDRPTKQKERQRARARDQEQKRHFLLKEQH